MKRITSLFLVAAAMLSATFAKAQESNAVMSAQALMDAEVQAQYVATATAASASSGSYALATDMAVNPATRLIENFVPKAIAAPVQSVFATSQVATSVPASVASLKGTYVLSWLTLADGSFDGGSAVEVVPDAEGDSITIKAFWDGAPVRAKVDATTGKITIPMQVIGEDANLGKLYFAVTNNDGKPNKTANAEGTVDADGNFNITSWWGIYVLSGTYKDQFVGAYYSTKMARTNATMSFKQNGNAVSYGVRVTQTGANVIRVENFFNKGIAIDILLNRDRTATIESQVALINSYGSWATIKCLEFNDEGALTKYNSTIVTDAAAADNNKTITWTNWSLLTTGKYAGRCTETVLTMDNAISYPELSVSDFEGEGTEANPYKLSSLDHLILLADKVNQDTAYVSTNGYQTYTRTFLGKHFELTADIDMAGYRFEPIGSTWKQRFAGSLDGKGHTIKGLSINGGSKYYAGLFGSCDTVSVLKNINFVNPVVSADYYYAAPLVAQCAGQVYNINVINPTVTVNNAKIVAAGVVGTCRGKIDNCHVTGGIITGGGYVGAIAGEALGGLTNCSANGTTVVNSGSSYPAGGIVGNLVYGDGKNLSFNGAVRYGYYEGQILGGVAGHVGACTLENSFFSGMVAGYSSDSYIGGVAGRLQGGTLLNCYSTGTVSCYSKKTGGIVGGITKYQPTGSN
ncbi:MAG: hypothetical protein K2J74_05485, partial [Muribaculaceae bacterium]|nr:hypothetical protein [Muribaculaceae bacterium]